MPAKLNQTPIPPGHGVSILLTIRANKSLYGFVYGPFRYDELRGCFVYTRPDKSVTFTLEEWRDQGDALLLKMERYRPNVRVEVAPLVAAAAEVEEPAAAPVGASEDATQAPAEPADEDSASPVKRSRAKAKTTPAAE